MWASSAASIVGPLWKYRDYSWYYAKVYWPEFVVPMCVAFLAAGLWTLRNWARLILMAGCWLVAITGSTTARAIDYSLGRWQVLTLYLEDGAVPCDNNWVENQIRPIAIGRSNWLFAGSLRAGKRAAAIMSLIQSAKLNGHDPYAYLKDVLTRLPAQRARDIAELLPQRWHPSASH